MAARRGPRAPDPGGQVADVVALRPAVDADAGFDAGFDAFFDLEYPRLVALVTALTGSRQQAEDVAQEAMLRAHQRWARIAGYERPGAWTRRVALNLAANQRARSRSEARAVARLSARPAPPPLPPEDEQLWSVLRTLPRRQAAALALHYLEDMPVAEVARVLGCAEGTAKAHLFKGRAALAQRLGEITP